MAVEVIATIKPKNNGKFPIVEAVDVDVNGKPLSEALNEFGNGNTPRFKVEDNDKLMVSYDNGKSFEYLATLPRGEKGNVTIDNRELRFYAGKTEEDFNNEVEDKTNVFAIIEDPEEGSLIGRINGFLDGSIPIPNLEQTYVRKDEQKIYSMSFGRSSEYDDLQPITSDFRYSLGSIPAGKSVDDIVGLSVQVMYMWSQHTSEMLWFQGGKLWPVFKGNELNSGSVEFEMSAPVRSSYTRMRGSFAHVVLYSEPHPDYEGTECMFLKFNDCEFWQYVADVATEVGNPARVSMNADISTNKFVLSRVTWWFA